MAGFGNGWVDDVLNREFRAVDYTPPTTHYIRLMRVMNDDAGAGGTELTGTGYAPVGVTRGTGAWSAPAAGSGNVRQIANAAAVDFGTAGSNWAPAGSECVGFEVWTASSGGRKVAGATFGTPLVIQATNPVRFAAGALVLGGD